MAHVIRIVEELSWTALKEKYFIGTRTSEVIARNAAGKAILVKGEPQLKKVSTFINELQDAIDSGEIDELVEKSARLYHNGNVQAVIQAIARKNSSQRCNMLKADYLPTKAVDLVRLETLDKYVEAKRGSKTEGINTKLPQWAFGPIEIDQIESITKLQAVINSINDACCDKAHGAYEKYLGADYINAAKANREYARNKKATMLAKENSIAPEILDSITAKLTPDEIAQLLKVLNK